MVTLKAIVDWYSLNRAYFDFSKEMVFVVGLIPTVIGYVKVLNFLTQRKALIKRQEMENDAKMYREVQSKLKEYVDGYGASLDNLRDIKISLLYIKNYPYELNDDGYNQMLYYYFMSKHHKASGYISSTGLYVMDHVWFFGNCIYYNSKNEKWFEDKKGLSFKGYIELDHEQLVRRIPFANIYGYDFNSYWADGPVFYTKYKYDNWKLYADELRAVTHDKEHHLAHAINLDKNKRTRRFWTVLSRYKLKLRRKFIK